MRRCDHCGHTYDNDLGRTCPFCNNHTYDPLYDGLDDGSFLTDRQVFYAVIGIVTIMAICAFIMTR